MSDTRLLEAAKRIVGSGSSPRVDMPEVPGHKCHIVTVDAMDELRAALAAATPAPEPAAVTRPSDGGRQVTPVVRHWRRRIHGDRMSLLLLLCAVIGLLTCFVVPSDTCIWITLAMFAAFGCSFLWTMIRSVRK